MFGKKFQTYFEVLFIPSHVSCVKVPQQLRGNVVKWVPYHVNEFQLGFQSFLYLVQ